MKLYIEFVDTDIIEKLDLNDLSMKALHDLAEKVTKELENRTHLR